MGENVRYDGGHRRDRYIVETLGKYFEFAPVCPEIAIGLGVPCEPIRLRGSLTNLRVVGVNNPGLDVTRKLRGMGRSVANDLHDISGYILKSGSPSCGMAGVKRYPGNAGRPVRDGVGQYAEALMSANPRLPVEEEGRLNDLVLRENFIERVFDYHDWLELTKSGETSDR